MKTTNSLNRAPILIAAICHACTVASFWFVYSRQLMYVLYMYTVYIERACFPVLVGSELVEVKNSPHAFFSFPKSMGTATQRESRGGHLAHLVIVCVFALGQGTQKRRASWLCSQNNWGNGETGTEPQGSSRRWYKALCKRDCVCCFQTSPLCLACMQNKPFSEGAA